MIFAVGNSYAALGVVFVSKGQNNKHVFHGIIGVYINLCWPANSALPVKGAP